MEIATEKVREAWGKDTDISGLIAALGSNVNKPSEKEMKAMLTSIASGDGEITATITTFITGDSEDGINLR